MRAPSPASLSSIACQSVRQVLAKGPAGAVAETRWVSATVSGLPMEHVEHRRRVPRVGTGRWPARCTIEADPEWIHARCEVVDLSLLGVGIEVDGGTFTGIEENRIVVEVQPPVGRSVTLQLIGHVRNVIQLASGRARIGIEFAGLSETEREILQVFQLLKVFW